jgi:hypothetical protein
MNIYGHNLAVKELQKSEEFWHKTAGKASRVNLRTEERLCNNFSEGERKKINWHKKQIKELKEGREDNRK